MNLLGDDVVKKRIKILIIPTGGLRREGITSSQLEYVKRLDCTRFSVTMAAVHNNAQDVIDEFRSYGCRVVKLPDRKEKKNIFKYYKSLRTLMKKGFDIVHVHGSSGIMAMELLIARQCGIKVRIAHSRNTRCDNNKIDKLLRPLFYREYTYALACGKEAGDWLFPGRRYEVLHNGKDFEKFCFDLDERIKVRRDLQLNGKIVYGHVGNINEQKNHKFLIEVFYEIKKKQDNALLYIMGDGPLMNEIKDKVRKMGLNDDVVFAGRVDDVYRRLQAMDVMLFPSLFEGLPNVVLEWQAEGLPCLISDSITRECMCTKLVNYMEIGKGPGAWADQAIALLINAESRKKLSEDAILKLKKEGFDIEESVQKLTGIYTKLVGETC